MGADILSPVWVRITLPIPTGDPYSCLTSAQTTMTEITGSHGHVDDDDDDVGQSVPARRRWRRQRAANATWTTMDTLMPHADTKNSNDRQSWPRGR